MQSVYCIHTCFRMTIPGALPGPLAGMFQGFLAGLCPWGLALWGICQIVSKSLRLFLSLGFLAANTVGSLFHMTFHFRASSPERGGLCHPPHRSREMGPKEAQSLGSHPGWAPHRVSSTPGAAAWPHAGLRA